MNDMEKKAAGIFDRFAEKLGSIDRRHAAALVAVAGVGLFFGGVVQEMQGQAHLMHAGGLAAIDAYNSAQQTMQLGLGDWLKSGVMGKLPGFGDNTEARGFLTATVAPALAAVSISLARGFTGMRESVAVVAQKLGIGEQVMDIVAKKNSLEVANDFASQSGETKVVNVQSGRYAGAVLFETDHHLVQDLGRQTAVVHDKGAFNAMDLTKAIERGGSLRVQYENGRAAIDTGKTRSQSHSL